MQFSHLFKKEEEEEEKALQAVWNENMLDTLNVSSSAVPKCDNEIL